VMNISDNWNSERMSVLIEVDVFIDNPPWFVSHVIIDLQ